MQLESWGTEQSVAASHNNDGRNVTRLNGAIVSRIITRQGDNRVNISTGATGATPPSGLDVLVR